MNLLLQYLKNHTLLVLIDQGIYSGTNFLLTFFIAQKLNLTDFGIFSSIILFTYLVLSVVHAIFIQPLQVNPQKNILQNSYQIILTIGIFIFLAIFSIILIIIYNSFIFFENLNITALILFIGAYILQDSLRKILITYHQLAYTIVSDTLFTLSLLILFYIQPQLNLNSSIWIIAISNCLACIPALFYFTKNYQLSKEWKKITFFHFTEGKWLIGVSFLQWGSSNLFVLISGVYLGIEALAALRLGQSLFGIINVILQSVENYFIPKIASLYAQNKEIARRYLYKISSYGILILILCLLPVCFYASSIIQFIGGESYKNYGIIIQLLSILYVFIFLSYPIRIAIRIKLLHQHFLIGYIISFAFTLLSFDFLLKYAGLYGAIFGLICNQTIMAIYWQYTLYQNKFILWKSYTSY